VPSPTKSAVHELLYLDCWYRLLGAKYVFDSARFIPLAVLALQGSKLSLSFLIYVTKNRMDTIQDKTLLNPKQQQQFNPCL